MTLYASVSLFACLTLVTTGALGSLEEQRRQAVGRKVHWHQVGCCPHLDRCSEDMRARAGHLQQGRGHQQGRWDQQDQKDPEESRGRQILAREAPAKGWHSMSCRMGPPLSQILFPHILSHYVHLS